MVNWPGALTRKIMNVAVTFNRRKISLVRTTTNFSANNKSEPNSIRAVNCH